MTMKLTTREIVNLANALVSLNGYQQSVSQGGKPAAIFLPYDFTAKARWNIARNLNILKRIAEAHQYVVNNLQRDLQAFMRSRDKAADPKVIKAEVEAETKKLNEQLKEISEQANDVDGLLMIPAEGLNLTRCPIPPETLSDLMPLIEGEPQFEAAKPPAPAPAK